MLNKNLTKALELAKKQDNYCNWMFDEIKPYLRGTILEVGSGLGTISERLYKHHKGKLIFSDISKDYWGLLKKRFPDIKVIKLDLNEINIKSLKQYNIDTIVCINVLEHVKDDIKVLKKMNKFLSDSGRIVLLVPAHEFLYNSFDREYGHYRRYSKNNLNFKLQNAGFCVKKMSFFSFFGMLGWFLDGNILKRKTVNNKRLKLLNKLIPFLRIVEKYLLFNITGVSIIAVGEKSYDKNQKRIKFVRHNEKK